MFKTLASLVQPTPGAKPAPGEKGGAKDGE